MSTFSSLGLSDIDAFVLTVRDRQSRQLIIEAIAAYRGGALRSSIISTWIAVAYDIIAKVRELASQGEKLPQGFIKELDSAIQSNNIKKQMEIEANLLARANNDFQLFAPHEYKALERLQRDRHLCAHPALVLDDEPYQPSPELVRAHIVHALQHLLIHAPLQGKSAIARFEADLLSASFPTTAGDINSFLRTRYLDRAKDVLVVNLIKAVFSALFGSEHAAYANKADTLSIILHEIEDAKPEIYKSEMPGYVAEKIEKTQDLVLLNICRFIKTDLRIWRWLKRPDQARIKRLIETANLESLKNSGALVALDIEPLSSTLLERFNSFDATDQIDVIVECPRKEFISKGIELYAQARSFRNAEFLGQSVILPLAKWYTDRDICQLLDAVGRNDQIWLANGTSKILEQVYDQTLPHLWKSRQYWEDFICRQTEKNDGNDSDYYSYPSLRERLEKNPYNAPF